VRAQLRALLDHHHHRVVEARPLLAARVHRLVVGGDELLEVDGAAQTRRATPHEEHVDGHLLALHRISGRAEARLAPA
jgi:hypothetical protein